MNPDPGLINWILLGGIIIICLIVIYLTSRYEDKRNERLKLEQQKKIQETAAEAPAFTVGQVYQMEDGTLARYAADGKFYKIKIKE